MVDSSYFLKILSFLIMAKGSVSKIFGPLIFEDSSHCSREVHLETKCILCEDSFNLKISLPVFAAHLFDVHNIIIEEIQTIGNLHEYVLFWRQRFKCTPLEQIIPCISLDSTQQRYFIFSTLLKEDKELRHKLKLEYTLQMQEFERADKSYVKPCLFCKLQFEVLAAPLDDILDGIKMDHHKRTNKMKSGDL